MEKKKTDVKFLIVFLAALAVFVYAAVQLGIIFMEYYKGEQTYGRLEGFTVFTEAGSSNGELPQEEEAQPEAFSVDFAGLKQINSDIVGWIRFENMNISYPIVQGEDNDYYLTHTFDHQEIKCGSIFMEAENAADFSDNNTFVYGHNMKDTSMFAKLNKFVNEEVYLDNPEFLIYTEDNIYRYEIFSCYQGKVDSDSFLYQFSSQEKYAEWQKTVKSRSYYDTGVVPSPEQKTVTLMTCTSAGEEYRFLVHGVLAETIPVTGDTQAE